MPYRVLPPTSLMVEEEVPVLRGPLTGDIVNWALELKKSVELSNARMRSIQEWRTYLAVPIDQREE